MRHRPNGPKANNSIPPAIHPVPRRRLLPLLTALALAIGAALAVNTAVAQPNATGPSQPAGKHERLDSLLDQLANPPAGIRDEPSTTPRAPMSDGSFVAVTIYFNKNQAEIVQELQFQDVTIRHAGPDYIEAFVPLPILNRASNIPGVTWIEPIYPPQELQSAGDGPTVHLSAPWNEDGFTGQGVRVGVIDGGFKDFSTHQGTDLPKSVTALCFNRISPGTTNDIATCETGSQHGSAVAEAIIDIAPDAELYISNPHTAADLQQAVQWMAKGWTSSTTPSAGAGTAPATAHLQTATAP